MEQELMLPEYAGLSYKEKLEKILSKTEPRVGRIEGENLKDVVTLLCSGLDWKLKNAPESFVKTALVRGFDSMNLPGFGFNLNDPTVMGLLNLANNTTINLEGSDVKLISDEERQFLVNLATYEAKKWPEATIKDIVSILEPSLLSSGGWVYLDSVPTNRLQLKTTTEMPEPTLVRVEMSETEDGVNWTNFKRVNHFYGVQQPDFYFATIPNNGLQRRIRIRGEVYELAGTVKAV